jgi:hypothetical protein
VLRLRGAAGALRFTEAYAFTMGVYRHFKQEGRITVREEMPAADLVAFLGRSERPWPWPE